MAPVTEFEILITLFVLLIGPVNYWLLKKWGRLHLLILTVPLAALVVTLGLFAYAMVSDGLGTRARIHSFTYLDSKAERSVSWARQSYYAGLSPSAGLKFSCDTAVYSIPSAWGKQGGMMSNRMFAPREMQWADQQYLTEGWLASRTPTQFLTVTSKQSTRKLGVSPTAKGLTVQNLLGTEIESLYVRDEEGNLFWCEALAAEATSTMKPITDIKAAASLRQLKSNNEPKSPMGYDDTSSGMFSRRGNRWSAFSTGEGTEGVLSANFMQASINSMTPLGTEGNPVGIGNGQFIAITKAAPEVEVGVPSFSEEASFHVMMGTWK